MVETVPISNNSSSSSSGGGGKLGGEQKAAKAEAKVKAAAATATAAATTAATATTISGLDQVSSMKREKLRVRQSEDGGSAALASASTGVCPWTLDRQREAGGQRSQVTLRRNN